MTDIHQFTGEREEHLKLAWQLAESWMRDRESAETFRLVRLSTMEFHPAETVMALTQLLVGVMAGAAEAIETDPLTLLSNVRADLAERSTT